MKHARAARGSFTGTLAVFSPARCRRFVARLIRVCLQHATDRKAERIGLRQHDRSVYQVIAISV